MKVIHISDLTITLYHLVPKTLIQCMIIQIHVYFFSFWNINFQLIKINQYHLHVGHYKCHLTILPDTHTKEHQSFQFSFPKTSFGQMFIKSLCYLYSPKANKNQKRKGVELRVLQ